jgi:hypothetical protein
MQEFSLVLILLQNIPLEYTYTVYTFTVLLYVMDKVFVT